MYTDTHASDIKRGEIALNEERETHITLIYS